MKTFTTCGRWLGLFLLFACFVGTSYGQRNVTLRLNTATLPDTTNINSLIEVRGAVGGAAPADLPDGNVIDWDSDTTLEPVNIGGDYWEINFQIPDDQEMLFKFYSEQAENPDGDPDTPDGIGGWEDNPAEGDNHSLAAGQGDVDLGLHYFNKGASNPYDWSPFEEKEDSVGVMFRVYMNTEEAVGSGVEYDRGDDTQVIGLRGDNFGGDGPLDWGATQVQFTSESDDPNAPGYHIFSGIAYYPTSLAGQTQAYKYFVEPGGWEQPDNSNPDNNRLFTIPQNDTTLHWVYYGDAIPLSGQEPVESAVLFTVDLTPLQDIGVFDTARGDSIFVYGDFNDWANCQGGRDRCWLPPVPGEPQYEQIIPITAIPGAVRNYKFFLKVDVESFKQEFGVDIVPSGWEEPISTQGANRTFEFEGTQSGFQDLGIALYNDIRPGNIIPDGTSIDVMFSVDMSSAVTNDADPFDPAADSVTVEFSDAFWIVTQGMPLRPRDDDPDLGDSVDLQEVLRNFLQLTDDDGDLVYEGTLTVRGPTYSGFQYKYTYGAGTEFTTEAGGDTSGQGRRRTRFIVPNADGSWPATYEIGLETYTQEGALPFDTNPATGTGIEVVDDEIPDRIALGQNYPNPFNPSTTFEYTIDRTQHVTIRVYDLLGRVVTTLVDGTQPAATYKVTFDASRLASGVYLYQIETPTKAISKRMVLLK